MLNRHAGSLNGRMRNSRYFWFTLILIAVIYSGWTLLVDAASGPETIEVRPDVVAWIDKHFGRNPRKKAAMLRLAESDQFIIFYPTSMALKIERADSIAMECYWLAFSETIGQPDGKIDGVPDLNAVSIQAFNTYSRTRRRNAYHHALSGGMYQLTKFNEWDEKCDRPLSL